MSWEQLRKARLQLRFQQRQQHHEKSKRWLPTDRIIGKIQSLRFAPGLETVSQAPFASRKRESEQQAEKALSLSLITKLGCFIAPTYTRGKPKPASMLGIARIEKSSIELNGVGKTGSEMAGLAGGRAAHPETKVYVQQ